MMAPSTTQDELPLTLATNPTLPVGIEEEPVVHILQTAFEDKVPDAIEEQIIKGYGSDLTKEDYQDALKEVEESLKLLSKASLTELRQQAKPHYLIEKTMQLVCTLKGFKTYNWSIAKEMVQRPQFKPELMQLRPKTLRAQDVLRAQQILQAKSNSMLTPQV